MYKRIHTYDLDGVLVDSSHRYRNKSDGTIDLAFWLANRTPEKIAKDKILPLASQYVQDCINPETYTILCTSRVYSVVDIAFIVGELGAPDKLIMRPEGNDGPDGPLKFKQLSQLFRLRQFQKLPRKLWEDNPLNIDALRPLFNQCFFVPSHITENLTDAE